MSDHDQTTAKAPAQPTPCKMGCGFFGSNATGDCCSKCYKDLQARQKKVDGDAQMTAEQAAPAAVEAAPAPMETEAKAEEASPMEVEETTPAVPAAPEEKGEEKAEEAAVPTPVKAKKKKKKKGYKNMIADMMAGNGDSPGDAKKDDAIKKVTGGGAFSKIDRI